MEEEIKRSTARRKSALVLAIIQGKTTGRRPVGSSIFHLGERALGRCLQVIDRKRLHKSSFEHQALHPAVR
jgi:hypothetical protein